MFKGISKFIPTGVALLVAVVLIAIGLSFYYTGGLEMFTDGADSSPEASVSGVEADQPRPARPEGSNEVFAESDEEQKKPCDPNMPVSPEASAAPCFPADQLTAEDLLPKGDDNEWARSNPKGNGSLDKMNFLEAGYHYGINTVGQTLRNANLQIRSEVPNPQVQISPFLQTTIEPDLARRVLEIGSC